MYTVPIGVIAAITNQRVGLNVITELIVGYLLPGRPIAMMMFKTWGYISMIQSLQFVNDLKLGHYMKIPPRAMFTCQVVATIISGTVQLGVQSWLFDNVEGICTSTQKDGFICPSTVVFGNASIMVRFFPKNSSLLLMSPLQWGVIGPNRLFSHGQLYYGLVFFLLVGAVLPLIQWTLHKKFRIRLLRYLNFPVLFASLLTFPPATPINFVPWVVICFIFNYVIRRRHFSWWAKYNCTSVISIRPPWIPDALGLIDILSAALDSSYAIGAVVIFFTLQYPNNGNIGLNTIQKWWGNTVYMKTADAQGLPIKTLAAGETFGPTSW